MEFNQTILTQNGRTLMAKAVSGQATIKFTKMRTSSSQYQLSQLEMLTNLSNVKQTADVETFKSNGVTAKVLAAFDNYNLTVGYDVRAVGLYALDPDAGEILYAVSTASVSGYMPPNNGTSATGLNITIYTEVGNADNVNMVVDSAAFATKAELRALEVNVAYANSADGTVDFSKVKPKENIYASSLIKWKNNINQDNDVFTMSTLSRGDINNIQFQFYTSGNLYIKESNITNVKLGRLGVKLTVPENAKYVRMYATNESQTSSAALDIFVDKLANKIITISFDLSVNSDNKYLYSKFKISEDEIVFYLPNKAINYRDSFMKYIGYSVKNSTNPSDYRWQVNPEWQRAQLDYEKASMIQDKLVNLISNADFSQESTGWTAVNSTLSVDNGMLKIIGDGTNESVRAYCGIGFVNTNDVFYMKCDLSTIKSSQNPLSSEIQLRSADLTIDNTINYNFKDNALSGLFKATKSYQHIFYVLQSYSSPSNASGNGFKIDNVAAYNLTSIFGAGNEPSLEEFERLLSINANSPTIYSQSITQAKLNAHSINSLYYTESAESPETTFGGKWTKLGTEAKFSKTFNVWQRTQ